MDLLSAVGGKEVTVKALVRAAELFDISGNSLRVALARLLAAGTIERNERGCYGIAASAEAVQAHVASWAALEDRMVPWTAGWIGVHTAALARDRAVVRRRTRALSFLGLAELTSGLWLRPDNLAGGVTDVRARLHRLGLDPEAPVFRLEALDADTDARARGLWRGADLARGYERTRKALAASAARLADLPLAEATVECFVLGGQAIRQLAYDPLLPEPIVPAAARRALVDEMRRYDRAGRRIWRTFLHAEGAPALESLLEFRQLGTGRSA
jgi:phenylacetic acid degradation operon negative regulatory protein